SPAGHIQNPDGNLATLVEVLPQLPHQFIVDVPDLVLGGEDDEPTALDPEPDGVAAVGILRLRPDLQGLPGPAEPADDRLPIRAVVVGEGDADHLGPDRSRGHGRWSLARRVDPRGWDHGNRFLGHGNHPGAPPVISPRSRYARVVGIATNTLAAR